MSQEPRACEESLPSLLHLTRHPENWLQGVQYQMTPPHLGLVAYHPEEKRPSPRGTLSEPKVPGPTYSASTL